MARASARLIGILALGLAGAFSLSKGKAGATVPCRLTQTIALPNVKGRIDHCAVDLAGERLFVCALGNNSLEVIDLRKGERIRSIAGLGSPQGVAYLPESNRLVVTNDRDGRCNFYDGKSFALTGTVDLKDDADNARYDASSRQLYVGYGRGGIAVINPAAQKVAAIELSAHPEAFVLEKNGPRIFVNLPGAGQVAVVDRVQATVVARWEMGAAAGNFPMAFDEAHHRLFVGCRSPAELVVLNSDSGATVTTIPIPADVDDVFYDGPQYRLFAICGGGSIAVIDQVTPNSYRMIATIPTASGARTGLFVPALNSLCVAVPQRGGKDAEVRRYALE